MMTLETFIAELNTKFAADGYAFSVETGRKYHKVIRRNGQDSLFCFVDKDGNIFKPKSFRAPADGVRATLATVNMERVDAHGGWLYAYRG